jgi:hypothetical protein
MEERFVAFLSQYRLPAVHAGTEKNHEILLFLPRIASCFVMITSKSVKMLQLKNICELS